MDTSLCIALSTYGSEPIKHAAHFPDDPEVLEKQILNANPKYRVVHKWKKLYAWVE